MRIMSSVCCKVYAVSKYIPVLFFADSCLGSGEVSALEGVLLLALLTAD